MVGAIETLDIQIPKRIIALGVIDIQQTSYLREVLVHCLQQLLRFIFGKETFCMNLLIRRLLAGLDMSGWSELNSHHPLARKRIPHDNSTQESLLGP